MQGVLAALLAGFALLPSAPAEAIDLVSNMSAGTGARGPTYQAQSFRTGSDAIEYSLTGVRLRFDRASQSPIRTDPPGRPVPDDWDVSVKLREDANGYPGALVATLTGSAGLGVRTFTAPPNTTLDANTTYWVSVNEGSSDTAVGPSGVTSDVESGLPGWTIGNAQWFRHSERDRWKASDGWSGGTLLPGYSALMAIRGYAHTLSTPANVSASAGNERVTLSWTAVTGAAGYEYQHKTLPTGACGTTGYGSWRSATAGTSHVVTGLSNGTRYCFRVRAKHAGHESAAATPVNATPVAGGTTAPTVSSFRPADGVSAVAVDANLVLTFNKRVRKGSGDIVIRPASGSDVTIAVTDSRVRVGGTTVTIDPAADLAEGAAYHVRIAAGAFEDLAGNAYAGIADATTWNFTTTATPPTVSSFSPADGATDVAQNAKLVITFSEPVRKGHGRIIISGTKPLRYGGYATDGGIIPVADSRVSVSGRKVTIDLSYHLGTLDIGFRYHVLIDGSAFEDLAGNAYAGIADATTWNFSIPKTDTTAPTVITRSPADDATGVAPNTDLVLTFSEPVRKGSVGGISISSYWGSDPYMPEIYITGNDHRGRISFSSDGRTVTIDPAANLAASTAYHVQFSGVFEDLSGNLYEHPGGDRTTWNFTTAAADTTAPTVSTYDPADGATDVWIDTRYPMVSLTFSEPVRKGSGNIVFRPASGPDIAISVTDRRVSVSGRTVAVDTANELAESTAYHVRIASGAFEDLSGNDYAGIADATTWNFATDGAPRIIGYGYRGATWNHRDRQYIVPVDTTLNLTFDEPVRKGSGNIVIRPASGADVTIPATSGQVSVSGSTVTIDPAVNLAASTRYHVRIASGAIEDLAGNAWAGISDATKMKFKRVRLFCDDLEGWQIAVSEQACGQTSSGARWR